MDRNRSPHVRPNAAATTDSPATSMKFWRNNRLDAEFTLPIAAVAGLFMTSLWNVPDSLLDRQLRGFLTDNSGPISAVWDDEDHYNQLVRLVESRLLGEPRLP